MSSSSEKWTNIKNLFALIIGIDDYPHATKLRGAVADADRFQSFLRDQVKVGNDRIISLRNDQATREKIEHAFCSLWDKQSIEHGDPIVIYFAGHGCQLRRPPRLDAGGRKEIEGIFPYDVQPNQPQETKTRIFPIPDITIAAFLNILSYKKGNNITVIFDCCHSASGARGEEVARSETFHGNLPDDIDQEYLKKFHDEVPQQFRNQHLLSHIFLAACGSDESAMETNNQGKFTTALLNALDEPDVDGSTYAQLMRSLPTIPGQNPQCEGNLKHRILFSNTMVLGRGEFSVTRTIISDKEIYRIDAGTIQGVHKNSLFNLYKTAAVYSETNKPICELRAERVFAFYTEAIVTNRQNGEVPKVGFARQKRSGKALAVHFTSSLRDVLKQGVGHPENTLCVETVNKDADSIVNINREADDDSHPDITLMIKKEAKDADFIVDTITDPDGEREVVFKTNLSVVTDHGFMRLPEGVPTKPERITDVLRAAHQWTQHLDKEVSIHQNWINNIKIEFCSLENIVDNEGVVTRQKKETLPFIEENTVSLKVLQGHEDDDMYGMVLHNNTNFDFHVTIVVFDIDGLVIEPHFTSALGVKGTGNADPSLRKGKRLIIGDENEGGYPFYFDYPKGDGINVTILKLYFTSIPMDFGWLKQESPFKMDIDRGSKPPEEVKRILSSQSRLGATASFTIVQHAIPS